MSSEVAGDVALVITGNNIEVTPALQEYVEKRIGGILNKLGSGGIVKECDVHLSVSKNPKVRLPLTRMVAIFIVLHMTFLLTPFVLPNLESTNNNTPHKQSISPKVKDGHRVDLTAILKGLTVHCKEETADMYTSIDSAATALSSKLRKYRTRRKQGWHSGNSMAEDLMAALEDAELGDEVAAEVANEERDESLSRLGDFIDPEEPNIMKVNSFDLENALPIKDAIFALDYVDHDFFVFKNEESGKPTVIYKRNAGGIGMIECE